MLYPQCFYRRWDSMKSLRFIHVADLHLDTAFGALAYDNSEALAKRMQDAPFEALENLIKLCKTTSPHFLIFSGDMYNSEEASLRARFALRDAFEELNEMSIPIYYAHGNHDPLNQEAKAEFASIVWPENVHTFSEDWTYLSYPPHEMDTENTDNTKEYKEIARIYGISHTTRQETRNLASMLEVLKAPCVQIGVLHTNVVGTQKKTKAKNNYAPCSLTDLQEKNMHYWALGHVHSPAILMETPLIAYAGSMQGLHINEEGAHGCLLIEFKNIEENHISSPEYSFHTLAPVEWHVLDVEIVPPKDDTEPENIMEIQNIISREISARIAATKLGKECTDLIFRIKLHGRSDLANQLHEKDVLKDLSHALQKKHKMPRVFIKDIQSTVRPLFNFETALERDDILGEILRVTQDLRNHKSLLIETEKEAAEPLKAKIARYTSNINSEDHEPAKDSKNSIEALIDKSEEICVEVFEPQQ